MCPAVPSVSGASAKRLDHSGSRQPCLVVGKRARIEKQPAIARPPDDGRVGRPQPPRKLVRTELPRIDGTDRPLELEQWKRPAADLGRSPNHAHGGEG